VGGDYNLVLLFEILRECLFFCVSPVGMFLSAEVVKSFDKEYEIKKGFGIMITSKGKRKWNNINLC